MNKVYFTLLLSIFSLQLYSATLVVNEGEHIQSAVIKAKPGDVIKVMPGYYSETIYIDKDDIKLTGVIIDRAMPVLDGKEKLFDGVLVAGHGVVIENLHIMKFRGNGIMTQGANNFIIRNNIVEGPGIYAIFPQFGKNGLIEHNTISKTDDGAIYIGMCENIDVLYNEAYGAVGGIILENSKNILVESNYLHDNVIGIVNGLVHGLPIKTASNFVIRNNFIVDNNVDNFAPAVSNLSGWPAGIGVYILGTDDLVMEGNLIKNNQTAGVIVDDSGSRRGGAVLDPDLDSSPNNNRILQNRFLDNGSNPRDHIGELLIKAGYTTGPDILSDGKGHNNCMADPKALVDLGTDNWTECAPESTVAVKTMLLPNPIETPSLTTEQKGRFTYLAVCTGCHSYSATIIGPPVVYMQAKYRDKPQDIVAFIKNPIKQNPAYPYMPPQDYMPDDVLMETAKYILGLNP